MIVVDGGLVSLEVVDKAGPDVKARVVDPGIILSRANLTFQRDGEIVREHNAMLPVLSSKVPSMLWCENHIYSRCCNRQHQQSIPFDCVVQCSVWPIACFGAFRQAGYKTVRQAARFTWMCLSHVDPIVVRQSAGVEYVAVLQRSPAIGITHFRMLCIFSLSSGCLWVAPEQWSPTGSARIRLGILMR